MIDYKKILQESWYSSREIHTGDMTHFSELEDCFAESGGGYFVGIVNYDDEVVVITNVSGKICRYIVSPDLYPAEDHHGEYGQIDDLIYDYLIKRVRRYGNHTRSVADVAVWKDEMTCIGQVYAGIDPDGNKIIAEVANKLLNGGGKSLDIVGVKDGDIRVRFGNVGIHI